MGDIRSAWSAYSKVSGGASRYSGITEGQVVGSLVIDQERR